MPIVTPIPLTGIVVKQSTRRITNDQPILGADDNPAAGRPVLAIGRDQWGNYSVAASTKTDTNGNYAFSSLAAGPNDRFVIVVIGDPALEEHSRIAGHITGVV